MNGQEKLDLFSGTISFYWYGADNILYGNEQYMQYDDDKLTVVIKNMDFLRCLSGLTKG